MDTKNGSSWELASQLPPLLSTSILTNLTIAIILVLAIRLLYNLYLHPLSSYKGPAYLVASDVSLAFMQLRGTSHHALKKAHQKYGNVVRIAPNTLSFIEPSAWNDIYGHRKGRAVLPKDPLFYNEMLLDRKTITMASDDDAVPIRRAINPAFSHKALLEQEPMLQGHVDRLMAQLAKTSREQDSVDIRKWFTFSMFDINSDFAFGEDLGCVRRGSYHEWVQFVVDYFYAATIIHQCHKFWPLNRLLASLIPPSVRDKKERHSEASLQRVRRRMNTPTDRPDFMFHFLRHAEKEQLSTPVIEAQATVVILAGSETSAVALTAAAYHILSNHDVYKKLCDEIRSTFATSAEMVLQDVLSKLPYLDAVVKETLRIHTPLANGFTRVVPDKGGVMISGNWVPQTTVVTINHYCANTSARNFRDPHTFIPDRWLNDPAYDGDNKDVVQPFSVGPRDCPGKR
ncbi:hypothetical protein MMC28_005211 [Mycoblastus sanguinarius]|nr:hypothetical protein [Mycoblastus sanguinarius]